ncbi:hypothetical protein JXC34_02485 [Candidatus Woesearchaeota archaeon]|nr:hypothetical protein [Candidatus Woesearchaeota archaeon]
MALNMHFPNVTPRNYFYLKNGQIIKNITELPDVLERLDNYTFNEHVKPERNDFAAWAYEVFRDSELSRILGNVKSKKDTIRVMNAYIRQKQAKDVPVLQNSEAQTVQLQQQKKANEQQPLQQSTQSNNNVNASSKQNMQYTASQSAQQPPAQPHASSQPPANNSQVKNTKNIPTNLPSGSQQKPGTTPVSEPAQPQPLSQPAKQPAGKSQDQQHSQPQSQASQIPKQNPDSPSEQHKSSEPFEPYHPFRKSSTMYAWKSSESVPIIKPQEVKEPPKITKPISPPKVPILSKPKVQPIQTIAQKPEQVKPVQQIRPQTQQIQSAPKPQIKKPVASPTLSTIAVKPQTIQPSKPVQAQTAQTKQDYQNINDPNEFFEKNPLTTGQRVDGKKKTYSATPLANIDVTGLASDKAVEAFQDKYSEAYQRMSELRKAGFDTTLVEIMLFRIPPKLKVYQASREEKDMVVVKRYLNEVIEELNNVK